MLGTSPIILILGAGPNIGQAVARTFASKGYKVALAARSLDEADSTDNQLNIKSDFANSDDIFDAFQRVNKVFGIPSVVVYNVSASTFTPPEDPFALPLAALNRDLAINVTSAFVAAQSAAAGFAQLPASASKTFIYTGNILNVTILPSFLDQGMGKSAGAHMIWLLQLHIKTVDSSKLFDLCSEPIATRLNDCRFYYGDQRKADGTAIYKVDGEAHAKIYWELVEEKTHGPWLQTFVKGVGYTKFDSQCASSS